MFNETAKWFIARESQELMSCDYQQLQQMAKAGMLFASDKIKHGKDGRWVSASEVPGLSLRPMPKMATTPQEAIKADPADNIELPKLPPLSGGSQEATRKRAAQNSRSWWTRWAFRSGLTFVIAFGLMIVFGFAAVAIIATYDHDEKSTLTLLLKIITGVASTVAGIALIPTVVLGPISLLELIIRTCFPPDPSLQPIQTQTIDALPEHSADEAVLNPDLPGLWNPETAAVWSYFLTPIFGAYIHAKNWRALGRPDKAKDNILWLWATVAYIVVVALLPSSPDSIAVNAICTVVGLGVLLTWYFSLAKPQARFITASFPRGYRKRPFMPVLLIGFSLEFAILYALHAAPVLFPALARPSESQIANEAQRIIQDEWQKDAVWKTASIKNIYMIHKSGNSYDCLVEATLQGQPQRLTFDVVCDGKAILLQRKQPGSLPTEANFR